MKTGIVVWVLLSINPATKLPEAIGVFEEAHVCVSTGQALSLQFPKQRFNCEWTVIYAKP